MKRIFRIFILLFFSLVVCDKANRSGGKLQTPDYLAVQQAAERFSPAIGVYGGEMVLPMLSVPSSLNPITATDPAANELTRLIYEGLVRIDGVTLTPQPGLARSWDMSPDGLAWTFHIRQGLQWSNGAAFSAYDVAFTFTTCIYNDSITPNPARNLFIINGKKASITVVDSLTVRFDLPAPFAPFLRAMSQEILPKHKYAQYVRRGRFSAYLGIQTPPDSVVGTGPFLPELYVPLQKIVLKKNPLYWQKDSAGHRLPYLEKLVYMVVPDHEAEVARFKRGECDYLMAAGEDFLGLQKDTTKGAYALYRIGPATGSNFLVFNQNAARDAATGKPYRDSIKLSWFKNVLFRKAVAFSIDKKAMANVAFNGMGYPQWSPMSPSEGYYYNPDVAQYAFDSAKAAEALLSAGFRYRGSDSVWEDGAGHAVEFSIVTNNGNVAREKIAEIICKNLGKLGFKVHCRILWFADLIRTIDNPPFDWDAALLGLSGGAEPQISEKVWRSSQALHVWFPGQKSPATPWEARIDSIFDAAGREMDENKRKTLYDEWQRIAADNVPLIFTVLPERIVCCARKFKNINPSLYGGLLHNIERLYIQPSK